MRTCGNSECENYGRGWDTEHHSMCPYCRGDYLHGKKDVDDFDGDIEVKELVKRKDCGLRSVTRKTSIRIRGVGKKEGFVMRAQGEKAEELADYVNKIVDEIIGKRGEDDGIEGC